MLDGIHLKVCGLTSLVDAEAADAAGADFLGFIFYPLSPRRLLLAQYLAMAPHLPDRRKVAVSVEPTDDELRAQLDAGFDFFQVHFSTDQPDGAVEGWSARVGFERLWLAPKLPPTAEVRPAWLASAQYLLLDTFQADKFGGTGKPGDWPKFARYRGQYPGTTWILSGGLSEHTIAEAVRASGARFVDVSSGVESAPGVKDARKLRSFAEALRGARLHAPGAGA